MQEKRNNSALHILMYHAILAYDGRPLLPMEDPYYAVMSDIFEAQMKYLEESDTEILRLSLAIDKANNVNEARKYVVLTFDDGLKSHYELAKPILERYGFIGHFFITAGDIGQAGYMSWDDVRDLRSAGHIIGSHGMSHRIFTALKQEAIIEEMKDSGLLISKMIGEAVDYFSLPYGAYNSDIAEIAKDCGYKAVLTSRMGINRRPLSLYQLRRISIRKNTSLQKFKSIIEQERIPAGDRFGCFSKKALQRIIGDKRYHNLRKMVLR